MPARARASLRSPGRYCLHATSKVPMQDFCSKNHQSLLLAVASLACAAAVFATTVFEGILSLWKMQHMGDAAYVNAACWKCSIEGCSI